MRRGGVKVSFWDSFARAVSDEREKGERVRVCVELSV